MPSNPAFQRLPEHFGLSMRAQVAQSVFAASHSTYNLSSQLTTSEVDEREYLRLNCGLGYIWESLKSLRQERDLPHA